MLLSQAGGLVVTILIPMGFGTAPEQKLHINHLKLIAVFYALKYFVANCRQCEILLRVDNTTALAYINRMGGIQYTTLNRLARNIWQWCEEKEIWIVASYIPSQENTDADRESRRTNIDTEWELVNFAFKKIVDRWGHPEINLFASRNNTKINKFCA